MSSGTLGSLTSVGEVLAGSTTAATFVWGFFKARASRRQQMNLELDKYLTRSLDGFTDLVKNLQSEIDRQGRERQGLVDNYEKLVAEAAEREERLIDELRAAGKREEDLVDEVSRLRAEVRALRGLLVKHGINEEAKFRDGNF